MTTPCLQPGPRDTRLSAGGRGGGQSVYIWEDVVHKQVLTKIPKPQHLRVRNHIVLFIPPVIIKGKFRQKGYLACSGVFGCKALGLPYILYCP